VRPEIRRVAKDNNRQRLSRLHEGDGNTESGRIPQATTLENEVLTVSLYSGCIPALALAGANAYWLWTEHWEHWSHMPPLEERTEYPYQNIRTKNFPWGDGDKTLL
jgi:hypothetical protein